MARLRRDFIAQLIALVALTWAAPALAQEAGEAGPAGLYDRPTLVLDPGMHTSPIVRADIDATGRYAVTGSDDKTVRVWSVEDGRLLRNIRLPAGPGHVGKVFAVAISPDDELIAAGGWTRWTEADPQDQIYIFDQATGAMVGRIEGLPSVVLHLTFSPDGRYLAAPLGASGLRVYDRHAGWAEVARDTDYADQSYGADFSPDGRLATTSYDGQVRLYDHSFHLVAKVQTTGGPQPVSIAFSPDGTKLAVGYLHSTAVDILDGRTLTPLSSPNTDGIYSGDLGIVAWSAEGRTLFAGGRYDRGDGINLVVAWADAGAGARRELPASRSTIMTLQPLPNGDLLVAASDPYLAVFEPDGDARWAQTPKQADLRNHRYSLAVSKDGQAVDFDYEALGEATARFDVSTRSLRHELPADDKTAPPEHEGLPIQNWEDTLHPTLDGAPLGLDPHEGSRSLAIHPKHDRFVLGTMWALRAYNAQGEQLWRNSAPGVVWAVNISGDGRLVVAAYGDGTIRWHRLDDGKELLAFFPLADRTNWVAWTPEGAYTATQGARNFLSWHVNRGWDSAAEAIPVSDIPEQHRPEVLPLVLQELNFVTALGIVEQREMWDAVQRRTNSVVPPGTQLHVLAVGVGDYNEEKAKHLRLEFADDDAWDVASALVNTQGSLYAKVNPQVLQNDKATGAGILRAIKSIAETMQQDDVVVFHFSGHGAVVGEALYLLPYEVDARDQVGIEDSAIESGALRKKLVQLAARGRVLVLLDACRSGAITEDGADTTVDASQLRTALAAANVTVLTSSSGQENSIEDEKWHNGAFTEVFLEALGREADGDHNGVVSMTELTRYVTAGVPRLVHAVDPKREQTPGVEMRFEHTIFAAGL